MLGMVASIFISALFRQRPPVAHCTESNPTGDLPAQEGPCLRGGGFIFEDDTGLCCLAFICTCTQASAHTCLHWHTGACQHIFAPACRRLHSLYLHLLTGALMGLPPHLSTSNKRKEAKNNVEEGGGPTRGSQKTWGVGIRRREMGKKKVQRHMYGNAICMLI